MSDAPGGTGPPGRPPPASPAFLLIALGDALRIEVEDGLREHRPALRHFSALGHLLSTPGLSYCGLARRSGVTAQSMPATLRQLEEAAAWSAARYRDEAASRSSG